MKEEINFNDNRDTEDAMKSFGVEKLNDQPHWAIRTLIVIWKIVLYPAIVLGLYYEGKFIASLF